MSELAEDSQSSVRKEDTSRCPHCDSVVSTSATQCLMCGGLLTIEPLSKEKDQTLVKEITPAASIIDVSPFETPDQFKAIMHERKSRSLFWIVGIISFVTFLVGLFMLRTGDAEITLALVPTTTPLPPTLTYTPTLTPMPTETTSPTETPTPINTPVPTETPRPPRFHSVAPGETLFGLSLFYRISADSIAAENGIPLNSSIQVGQQFSIPWPTPTPPLESLMMEINGETIIADVTDCEIITIAEGDSAYGLSAQKGVPVEAIVAVNRLTDESIQMLHPGDTLCVPKVIYGDTLPPTPGPSPTITMTSFPEGPNLLYPINEQEIQEPDGVITLQWVAIKDLEENEWYMVELLDLDLLDALPLRAFTRDTSFHIPSSWRPIEPESHKMRWRISIVQVTGERSDGEFIYRYGGNSSENGYFTWLGAVPTPTPTNTPLPTETPQS